MKYLLVTKTGVHSTPELKECLHSFKLPTPKKLTIKLDDSTDLAPIPTITCYWRTYILRVNEQSRTISGYFDIELSESEIERILMEYYTCKSKT